MDWFVSVLAPHGANCSPAIPPRRHRRRQSKRRALAGAVAYVRESTEEQGRGYSPDGQRQAIARYAADHGIQPRSRSTWTSRPAAPPDKRPGFQRLIEDAMEHKLRVVLVFHTCGSRATPWRPSATRSSCAPSSGIDVISVTQPLGADADDPAAFLSESVHEIFDEYYSVSLSFWTKMGLREKARQGLLTGSLPWGYLKGEDAHRAARPRARAIRAQDLRDVRQRATH